MSTLATKRATWLSPFRQAPADLSTSRSGRALFLCRRLQMALECILIRGPEHSVSRHQAFGPWQAQGLFESLRVRMLAQHVSQEGLTLRRRFRGRRECLALLTPDSTPGHHLLQP